MKSTAAPQARELSLAGVRKIGDLARGEPSLAGERVPRVFADELAFEALELLRVEVRRLQLLLVDAANPDGGSNLSFVAVGAQVPELGSRAPGAHRLRRLAFHHVEEKRPAACRTGLDPDPSLLFRDDVEFLPGGDLGNNGRP